jgi:hypothetical protein
LQHVHLNSAIGYITPKDVLAGRQQEIHADRDRKLAAARQQRRFAGNQGQEGSLRLAMRDDESKPVFC